MIHTQWESSEDGKSGKDTPGQILLAFIISKHIRDSLDPETQLQLSRANNHTVGKTNTDRTPCGLKRGARDYRQEEERLEMPSR